MSSGLVVRDSVDIEEVRRSVQEVSAHAYLEMLPQYLLLVRGSDDPEVWRRALTLLAEHGALKVPQPKEDGDKPPTIVFNINRRTTLLATAPDGTTHSVELVPDQNEKTEPALLLSDVEEIAETIDAADYDDADDRLHPKSDW